MINRLIEVIGKEAAVFEAFLGLLERQQKMLLANDGDGLKRVTAEMHEKLTESQALNDRRERMVAQIKLANDIEGDLNVTRLLAIVDREQGARLVELRELIFAAHDKITETRNQNALLLNRSREYIHKTMEMLSRINSPEPTYGAVGQNDRVTGRVALDRRV